MKFMFAILQQFFAQWLVTEAASIQETSQHKLPQTVTLV